MLDFAKIKQEQSSSSVHLRLSLSIRDKAKELARQSSTADIKITESDVYRTIIALFFEQSDTKCSQHQIENVDEKGGDAGQPA